MRWLTWRIYVLYLKLRGIRYATRALFHCHRKLRLSILRNFGAQIGSGTRINGPFHVIGRYRDFSTFKVGSDCHIGADTLVDLTAPVYIGQHVAISPRCSLITHLNVGDGTLKLRYPYQREGITIEDNVYLGTGVTVLKGITIGNGALVAAGAIVTRDIPPHTMVAGIPARTIKQLNKNDHDK